MSSDIILDNWVLPEYIDIHRGNQKKPDIDRKELDKNIQKNREIVMRMRNNKKYEKILQEV